MGWGEWTVDNITRDEAGAGSLMNKTVLMELISISTADADDQKGVMRDKLSQSE